MVKFCFANVPYRVRENIDVVFALANVLVSTACCGNALECFWDDSKDFISLVIPLQR